MKILTISFIVLISTGTIKAQKVSVSAGSDIVSSYIWRGLALDGASFQPSISLSAGGFSIGTWGSANLSGIYEFDLYASYTVGNFSAVITDYSFAPVDYFDYSTHTFEVGLAYTISESLPLSLAWYTNFAGADDRDEDGNNDFSSYFEVGYPISAGDIEIDLAVGLTPWSGAYSNGFSVINASIKASKEIKITDLFSLPVFTQAVVNPDSKQAYLVFGVSF